MEDSDGASVRKRHSAASMVRILEDEIVGGALLPGHRLDEQALARRFDVSRTPVREALRSLASGGLIELRRNQGAAVRSVTTSDLIEMFQVLAELEGLAVRLCARRMTDEDIDELRALNEACAQQAAARDHGAFFAMNMAFHAVIYRCARNRFLSEESSKLRRRVDVYRRHVTYQPRRMVHSVDEHNRIIEAIAAGDGDRADALMRDHVDLLAGSATDVLVALDGRMETAAGAADAHPEGDTVAARGEWTGKPEDS